MKKNVWTAKDAAKEVGVSYSRIRQLALADEIDHYYFGRTLVITEQGINDAKNRKKTPGPAKQNERRKAA
jgi:hypothetical protein